MINQRRDEFGDPLLTCCGGVQFAAHLSEPSINLLESAINLLEASIDVPTQINEVLSKRIETRGGGVSKIADLGSDLRDVAVGRAGEHPSCRGVLFGCLEPTLDVSEIILTHGQSLPPRRRQIMRLARDPVDNGRAVQHDWETRRLLTFEQARRVVQINDKHRPVDIDGRPYPVAGWGWENDEVFVVPFDYGGDIPAPDEPARLVDKRSGELIFRAAGETPSGLRPVDRSAG